MLSLLFLIPTRNALPNNFSKLELSLLNTQSNLHIINERKNNSTEQIKNSFNPYRLIKHGFLNMYLSFKIKKYEKKESELHQKIDVYF